jgi:hypothetical protein
MGAKGARAAVSYKGLEEYFKGKEPTFPPGVVAETVAAYGQVGDRLASDPELCNAVRTIAAFWKGGPADDLLHDPSIATLPYEIGDRQGRLAGIEQIADEITNPKSIKETRDWLLKTEPEEQT